MTTAPHEAWKRNIRGRSAAHCREARQGERESWISASIRNIRSSPAGPANDLPSQGLYISSVEDYSDLNNHDITVGDVILTADGVTLETTSDLLDVLETHKPGETVRLEIQKRGSGNVVTVDAVLAESRSN